MKTRQMFRRLIAVVLAAAMLAVFAPLSGTVDAQGTAGCPILITMYDTLYVRSGPTWASSISTTLTAGELVCLTGRNSATTWIQVSRQGGAVVGWAPANAFWTTVSLTTLPVKDGTTPTPPPPPNPPTQTTYVVQPGDTVFSIAQQFGITINALVAANSIGADYRIYVGQTLVIPGATTPPSGYITYTVQRGDYLVKIANQYGTTWPALAQLNNITAPYVIYAGQQLLVPTAG